MPKERFSIKWTRTLKDKESILEFEKILNDRILNDRVTKRLLGILEEIKQDTYKQISSKEEMDNNSNWPLKQAYNSGVLSLIKQIEDLYKKGKDTK